jgi:hypothetical protein
MAVGILFEIKGGTQAQYDAAVKRLKEIDLWPPKGRLYHAGGPTEDGVRVVDVWTSEADFEKFAAKMVPIAQAAGLPPFEPEFWPVEIISIGQ